MHALLLSALLAISAPQNVTALKIEPTGPSDYSPPIVWLAQTAGTIKGGPGEYLQLLPAAEFANAVKISASLQCSAEKPSGFGASMAIETYARGHLTATCNVTPQQVCTVLDQTKGRTATDATMHHLALHPEATDGGAHDLYLFLECGRRATN